MKYVEFDQSRPMDLYYWAAWQLTLTQLTMTR